MPCIVDAYVFQMPFVFGFCRSLSRKHFLKLSTFADRWNHYLITTPIYYLNSVPHIGHAYTSVLADVLGKYQKLIQPSINIFLSVGTDEHGMKVKEAANLVKNGHKHPLSFCDEQSRVFMNLFDELNITYSAFVRTTDDSHKEKVQSFWDELKCEGFISKGEYKGWYCTSDEEFVSERDIMESTLPNGSVIKVSKHSGSSVECLTEQNYLFDLKPFESDVKKAINEGLVRPKVYGDIVLKWIEEEGIMNQHLSISRPRDRCDWGIEVPGDPTQTIYVWLDALVNYLTVSETNKIINNFWPAEIQIVGKDILKFHAVFWLSFLLATGRKLPQTILCHSHWLSEGRKMSKSKANVVDPFKFLGANCSDILRLYLSQGMVARDNNFSIKAVQELSDNFANVFGNALGRVMNQKCLDIIETAFPDPSQLQMEEVLNSSAETLNKLEEAISKCKMHYSTYQIHSVWQTVSEVLNSLNKFIQDSKFWKRYDDVNYVSSILYISFEVMRCCAILLWPITPLTSTELLERLAIRPNETCLSYCKSYISEGDAPPWKNRSLYPSKIPLVRKTEFL